MTVLVTGGTGFVGSHVITALLQAGHPVRGLVRSRSKAEALGLGNVEWVAGDLTDTAALEAATRGVSAIIHLAGLVAARSELEFLSTNRDGTERLVRAAAETQARFVHVSSLAAAGPSQPGQPLSGDEPPRPVSAYGRSKLASEHAVRAGPLPWVILRPPAVYGPRDREMFRIFRAATFGVAPVFGTGSQELSLVYGPDLAEAIVAATMAEGMEGTVCYPAHAEVLTARQVAMTIGEASGRQVRILGIPQPLARGALQLTGAFARLTNRATLLTPDKGNELFQRAWTCDPAGLNQATGWQARHDLAQGALETYHWYLGAGWL
ncbi:MAG: NAD(P)-dependent oxidoreductase [Gemmatimonadota bacterium]